MLNLTIKLLNVETEWSEATGGATIRVKLELFGYTLIESDVRFNDDETYPEWSTSIDLIRWYYKTSRK